MYKKSDIMYTNLKGRMDMNFTKKKKIKNVFKKNINLNTDSDHSTL